MVKLTDHFNINRTLNMKNSLQCKTNETSYNLSFTKLLYNNLLAIKLSNEFKSEQLFNPSINFNSRLLAPFVLTGGLNFDQTMNLSIQKEETPSSRIGYKISTKFSPDKFEISPDVSYSLTKDVSLSSSWTIDS